MRPLGRLSVGILVAVVAVILAVQPTIGGIDTWKVVLGVIGLALFVIKNRGESPRKKELVKNKLIMPGGVDVSDQIYVVGPLFGPGALMKVN